MKIYHKFLLYQNKLLKPYIRIILGLVEALTYLASLTLIVGVIYEHGFPLSVDEIAKIQVLYKAVWIIFLIDVTLHISLEYRSTKKQYRKLAWILSGLLYLTLIPVIFHRPEEEGAILQFWEFLDGKFYHLILLLVFSLLNLSNGLVRLLGRRTNPSLILAVSFLAIILIGTGLLMLPKCTVNGITWVDSLFTATSAVCVTGLVPVDVSTTFTTGGLVVIILLIQIGGLGVMTLTSFFAMFFMGNTSLYNQLVVRDMVSSNSLGSLLSTLLYILGFTLVIEGIGMVSIWFSIHGTLGMNLDEELAFAAFHSISAFCNAGFSTLPGNLYDPLIRHLYGLQVILAFLIIFGGIGFPILFNYGRLLHYGIRNKIKCLLGMNYKVVHEPRIVSTTTRIVLPTTLILLVVGTALFWIFENHNVLDGMSFTGKFATSFMGAVTPRTAGFNNVDMSMLHVPTIFLTIFLMWIGAAPMSTGGGIKVTTFVIALKNIWANLAGNDRVVIAHRQLTRENVNRAHSIIILSILWIILAVFVIVILEPKATLTQAVFEVVSALGTVGLTLNLTPHLCVASKMTIALTMFVGRVGLITLLACFIRHQDVKLYTYPDETVIV